VLPPGAGALESRPDDNLVPHNGFRMTTQAGPTARASERPGAWGAPAAILACALLGGCLPHTQLPAQPAADRVYITTMAGRPPLRRHDLRDQAQIAALVAFINGLPSHWDVPWYGPSVGRVYFTFFSGRKSVGNFYVGPDFFGRDTDRHYSEGASRSRIEELGRIVGIDLWGYMRGSSNGDLPGAAPSPAPSPAPTKAPAPTQPPRRP